MITAWLPTEKGLQRTDVAVDNLPVEAVWIDAVDITREEEAFLEKRLGIEMPTRAEMQEIEASSRLYREGQAVYMRPPSNVSPTCWNWSAWNWRTSPSRPSACVRPAARSTCSVR